jgi:peptidyl-tRNA hydrolase, PTH1 family
MTYLIIGLGNPEDKYSGTRHNAGHIVLEHVRTTHGFPSWEETERSRVRARVSSGELHGKKVTLIAPETYMNISGKVFSLIDSPSLENQDYLTLIHDDIDLPLGEFKISVGRGSGGHKGVESIIETLKTKNFIRIRVGISPKTIFGKLKKPKGEAGVERFVLGKFSSGELRRLESSAKRIADAVSLIVKRGAESAMNEHH